MIILLVLAIVLDAAFGDPPKLPHPVALIGRLIAALEKRLRSFPTSRSLRMAGVWLCVIVVFASGAAAFLISLVHPVFMAYLLYAALAARCLSDEAAGVQRALGESLDAARRRVARLVGRETDRLSREQVVMAAVETVAENTADGAVSPLLYMLLGALPALLAGFALLPAELLRPFAALSIAHGWLFGLPAALAWAFKAASTLDSMVGYKNERYIDLGRCSAKLDDVLNFIPARLTGVLMCVCAPVFGMDGKNAFRIMRRDHAKHPSPNSAWSEAAAAGALNIQLGGGAYYSGVFMEKEALGDALRKPEPEDIKRARLLLWGAYGLAAAIGLALAGACGFVCVYAPLMS